MERKSHLLFWVAVWLTLVIFGTVPALVTGLVASSPQPDPWTLLRSEAGGCARVLDAHLKHWRERASTLARELSVLLSQLPEGPIGTAAGGTLSLHLQRRLRQDPEMDIYFVLDPKGKLILTTEGRKPDKDTAVIPQMAQAAQRPAAALIRSSRNRIDLVVGAPIRIGSDLRGIFVSCVRSDVSGHVFKASTKEIRVDLVDASGHSLRGQAADPALLDLGSSSRSGRTWLNRLPVAYVPLRGMRAVVTATGSATTPSIVFGWPHVAGLAGIVLIAGLVTWMLKRIYGRF